MTNQPNNSLTIISLQDVNIEHEKKLVLSNISINFNKGDHWAIIGPNGSGKTTLMKLLAGMHWPSAGNGKRLYNFDGEIQNDSVLALKRIYLLGHELQDSFTHKDWNFKALDIVIAGIKRTDILRDEPTQKDKIKARALLKEVDASNLASKNFFELSRGQQSKVLIARILAFNPEVILLDEPLSGLDKQSRQKLNKSIDLISKKCMVICSYHHTGDLPNCINKIAFIENSSVIYQGNILPKHKSSNSLAIDSNTFTQKKIDGIENSERMIEITNASVWIKKERILNQITWQLNKSQHWQILGPNGSGKSTFLRLIYGLLRPARGGQLYYPGINNPKDVWSLRKQIAWVSPELQSNYWYPTNVTQCMASGLTSSIGQTKKPNEIEQKIIESLISIFHLEELKNHNVKKLSYGQFRRTLIARALVTQPKILLLDEPWEGLDPENLIRIARILNSLIKKNDTQIICATHLDEPGVEFSHQLRFNEGEIIDQMIL
jgi:molybdate transport system ATP-binding protein